jgi:uncharacterized protein YdeI (YjbR/CyaY-like superfamily)
MKIMNFASAPELLAWLAKTTADRKEFCCAFATLNKTNLYSIAYRLQTAKKPDTREKRMRAIIEKLARGEKFH